MVHKMIHFLLTQSAPLTKKVIISCLIYFHFSFFIFCVWHDVFYLPNNFLWLYQDRTFSYVCFSLELFLELLLLLDVSLSSMKKFYSLNTHILYIILYIHRNNICCFDSRFFWVSKKRISLINKVPESYKVINVI